jgi:hypothetical protein
VRRKKGRYLDWAQLLHRVFELDVRRCPRCGLVGMQQIAVITEAEVIRDILACLGKPTGPPQLEPARWPAQGDFDFDVA